MESKAYFTLLSLLLIIALNICPKASAQDVQDQIMDAIKKASASLPKGMKVNTMGMDDMAKQAENGDEDDEEQEKKLVLPDGMTEDNDVVVLTDKAYADWLFPESEKTPILVEFYAPWCGHCKSLQPEYERAAKRLKNLKNPVYLAKVDSTVETELAEKYEVSGYPTLKWFRNGQAFDYDGGRDEDSIVEYMKKRSSPDWKPPPIAVLSLDKDNFTDFINGHDLSLVEFYAPWCGHCKKLAPEYEKAAQELKEGPEPIPLAKVDATAESEVAQEYGVTGYPTLKVFRRGTVYEYKGGKDKFGIISYMEKQRGDPSKLFNNLKDLQASMETDDVTVVGFFNKDTDFEYIRYIEAVNDLRDDYKIAHTFDTSVRDHYKVNPNTLVMFQAEKFYTKFEPKYTTFEVQDQMKASEVSGYIKNKHVPLVGEYGPSTSSKRYTMRPLLIAFYTVDFSFDGQKVTQMWRNRLAAIAKEYPKITFAIADEDKNKDIWKAFGFEDSGEEINVGILADGDKKYPMEPMDGFDDDQITEFITEYNKGNIKPILKSQQAPKKQGVVKTIVGKTFEKIVYDTSKDVLIELYAPWCGHCKKLEPIFKELAKRYKKNKKLVIAKMDATANDAPSEYKAEGFPTIYFAPATKDKLSPMKYEGGRELKDFEEFLQEEALFSLGENVKEEL